MNYCVEGLQGSGKSTMLDRLSEKHPHHRVFREGDYSPVELAWCAYMSKADYAAVLDRYNAIRSQIEEKSFEEGDRMVVCYTKVMTDNREFYQDLERYEIYNGRKGLDEFEDIILGRYQRWNGSDMIFECSLLQNTIEDMILFSNASDSDIIRLYEKIRDILSGKDIHIVYLYTRDVAASIDIIRKERTDDKGNEVWFNMLCGYFDSSPYAAAHGLSGEKALTDHLSHRQQLEMTICREVFGDCNTILSSKKYDTSMLP